MPGQAGLSRHDDVVTELRRSGDAGLRDDQTVLADANVVCDLHEVVDLRALADHGFAECAPVDGRIRSDLDIVFDPYDSDLRNLAMPSAHDNESVAVGPDHHAAVHNASASDLRAVVDRDVRVDDRVAADHDVLADRGERADRHIRSESGGRGDRRQRRDASRIFSIVEPAVEDFRQRSVRLLHADEARVVSIDVAGDEDRSGSSRRNLRDVGLVADEGDLLLGGVSERPYAADDTIAGAVVAASDERDDVSDCNPRHSRGIVNQASGIRRRASVFLTPDA